MIDTDTLAQHNLTEGEYRKIADYNSWDLIATFELYKVWKDYIKS